MEADFATYLPPNEAHAMLALMKGSVLLIDDESANLGLLKGMLRKFGDIAVRAESDSKAALATLEDTEFDVIVTDIVMPEVDGLEILRFAKDKWPETEVIMLSGNMTTDRALEALSLHAFDFIPKPVELEKFRTMVRHAMEKRQLVQENKRMTIELHEYNIALQGKVDEATRELQHKVHELDIYSRNYRAILDHMPSGCLILDREKAVFQINQAAAEIAGFKSAEAAIGEKLISRPRLEPLLEVLDELKAGEPSTKGQIQLPTEGGNPTILRLAASRVEVTSGEEFYVAIIDDITQMNALERQLRKQERLATVGGLAAGIAHEIKNPLGAIRGLGELLSMKIEAVTQLRKFSDNIMSEVDRLNKIINDIVRFSREVTPILQEVDFRRVLEELAGQYREQAEKRTISLQIDGEITNIPYHYAYLKQALENIIDNLMMAIEDSSEVTISAAVNGEFLDLVIADTGCGIAQEDLPKIFKPFYSTRKARGSGLGLTIAEKVVLDHGGKIVVTSQLNEGTEVTIHLPLTATARTE